MAWVAATDVAPSGPPPWIVDSELDGDARHRPRPARRMRTLPVAPPPVTAGQIAVVDDDSGVLLYGRDAHDREAPASTTKIATAIVALEHAQSLDTTDADHRRRVGDGRRRRVVDHGTLAWPAAQRAHAAVRPAAAERQRRRRAARAQRRRLARAVRRLDERAGRRRPAAWPTRTSSTRSGLDADGHYSSAYDLAQLARRAMREDVFRDIVATPTIRSDGLVLDGSQPADRRLPRRRRRQDRHDRRRRQSHRRLSAVHNGHRVYVVAMHSEDLLADCSALFDWAWQSFTW